MPFLDELATELGPRGLVVVGLCDEPAANQRAIAGPAGVTYPLLVETATMPAPLGEVSAFPAFLLVDRAGAVLGPVFPQKHLIRRAVERAL